MKTHHFEIISFSCFKLHHTYLIWHTVFTKANFISPVNISSLTLIHPSLISLLCNRPVIFTCLSEICTLQTDYIRFKIVSSRYHTFTSWRQCGYLKVLTFHVFVHIVFLNFSISPSICLIALSLSGFDRFLASISLNCRHLIGFLLIFLQLRRPFNFFFRLSLDLLSSPRFLHYPNCLLILSFIFSVLNIFRKPLQCLFHIIASFFRTGP